MDKGAGCGLCEDGERLFDIIVARERPHPGIVFGEGRHSCRPLSMGRVDILPLSLGAGSVRRLDLKSDLHSNRATRPMCPRF